MIPLVHAASLTERVRRRYTSERRWRLARFTAVVAAIVYSARAVQQLVTPLPSTTRVNVVDFAQYFRAAGDLNAGRDPYQYFLQKCGNQWCSGGYIYPPLHAEMLRPLVGLGVEGAARVWLIVCHILLLASIVLVRRALGGSASRTSQAVLLSAALLFLPLYQSLYSVQVGVLLVFLLAVVGFGVVRGREGLAGAALAGAVVLRLTPLALVPLLVNRRSRSRPVGLIAFVAVAVGLLLGLEALTPATWEYFTTVLPKLGGGTAFLENQSLMGVAQRAGNLLFGRATLIAPIAALAISALLMLFTWLLSLRAPAPGARPIAFAAFVALMPIVSSLTWQHHLVTEILSIAFLTPTLMKPGHRRALGLVLAAYPLLWVDRHVTDPLSALLGLTSPRGWVIAPFLVVTGLNLLGMILLWMASVDCLWKARSSEG